MIGKRERGRERGECSSKSDRNCTASVAPIEGVNKRKKEGRKEGRIIIKFDDERQCGIKVILNGMGGRPDRKNK